MPRQLPHVRTLSEAVCYVIESNIEDGYRPMRFIQITERGTAVDLLNICRRLITKAELLEFLEQDFQRYPNMIVLEDFVKDRGAEWGFDEKAITIAKQRSEWFDKIAGKPRLVITTPQ